MSAPTGPPPAEADLPPPPPYSDALDFPDVPTFPANVAVGLANTSATEEEASLPELGLLLDDSIFEPPPLADDTGGSEPPTDAAPPVTAPVNPFRQALQAFLPRPTPAANVAAAAAVGCAIVPLQPPAPLPASPAPLLPFGPPPIPSPLPGPSTHSPQSNPPRPSPHYRPPSPPADPAAGDDPPPPYSPPHAAAGPPADTPQAAIQLIAPSDPLVLQVPHVPPQRMVALTRLLEKDLGLDKAQAKVRWAPEGGKGAAQRFRGTVTFESEADVHRAMDPLRNFCATLPAPPQPPSGPLPTSALAPASSPASPAVSLAPPPTAPPHPGPLAYTSPAPTPFPSPFPPPPSLPPPDARPPTHDTADPLAAPRLISTPNPLEWLVPFVPTLEMRKLVTLLNAELPATAFKVQWLPEREHVCAKKGILTRGRVTFFAAADAQRVRGRLEAFCASLPPPIPKAGPAPSPPAPTLAPSPGGPTPPWQPPTSAVPRSPSPTAPPLSRPDPAASLAPAPAPPACLPPSSSPPPPGPPPPPARQPPAIAGPISTQNPRELLVPHIPPPQIPILVSLLNRDLGLPPPRPTVKWTTEKEFVSARGATLQRALVTFNTPADADRAAPRLRAFCAALPPPVPCPASVAGAHPAGPWPPIRPAQPAAPPTPPPPPSPPPPAPLLDDDGAPAGVPPSYEEALGPLTTEDPLQLVVPHVPMLRMPALLAVLNRELRLPPPASRVHWAREADFADDKGGYLNQATITFQTSEGVERAFPLLRSFCAALPTPLPRPGAAGAAPPPAPVSFAPPPPPSPRLAAHAVHVPPAPSPAPAGRVAWLALSGLPHMRDRTILHTTIRGFVERFGKVEEVLHQVTLDAAAFNGRALVRLSALTSEFAQLPEEVTERGTTFRKVKSAALDAERQLAVCGDPPGGRPGPAEAARHTGGRQDADVAAGYPPEASFPPRLPGADPAQRPPLGWEVRESHSNPGNHYYYNPRTHETCWSLPEADPTPGRPAPPSPAPPPRPSALKPPSPAPTPQPLSHEGVLKRKAAQDLAAAHPTPPDPLAGFRNRLSRTTPAAPKPAVAGAPRPKAPPQPVWSLLGTAPSRLSTNLIPTTPPATSATAKPKPSPSKPKPRPAPVPTAAAKGASSKAGTADDALVISDSDPDEEPKARPPTRPSPKAAAAQPKQPKASPKPLLVATKPKSKPTESPRAPKGSPRPAPSPSTPAARPAEILLDEEEAEASPPPASTGPALTHTSNAAPTSASASAPEGPACPPAKEAQREERRREKRERQQEREAKREAKRARKEERRAREAATGGPAAEASAQKDPSTPDPPLSSPLAVSLPAAPSGLPPPSPSSTASLPPATPRPISLSRTDGPPPASPTRPAVLPPTTLPPTTTPPATPAAAVTTPPATPAAAVADSSPPTVAKDEPGSPQSLPVRKRRRAVVESDSSSSSSKKGKPQPKPSPKQGKPPPRGSPDPDPPASGMLVLVARKGLAAVAGVEGTAVSVLYAMAKARNAKAQQVPTNRKVEVLRAPSGDPLRVVDPAAPAAWCVSESVLRVVAGDVLAVQLRREGPSLGRVLRKPEVYRMEVEVDGDVFQIQEGEQFNWKLLMVEGALPADQRPERLAPGALLAMKDDAAGRWVAWFATDYDEDGFLYVRDVVQPRAPRVPTTGAVTPLAVDGRVLRLQDPEGHSGCDRLADLSSLATGDVVVLRPAEGAVFGLVATTTAEGAQVRVPLLDQTLTVTADHLLDIARVPVCH